MNTIFSGISRLQAIKNTVYHISRFQAAVAPSLTKGKYRMYLKMSSKNNIDFFKTWANLERS